MTPAPAPDLPLSEWAQGVRAGDLAAFEALFHALHPMLTRHARALAATPAEADDAVQETFVRLWEQRARIDPAKSLRAYLVQAVRNRMLNAVRDAQTRTSLLSEHALASADEAHAERPDEVAHGVALADRLTAFLAELPDRQRTALTLTRFDGLSHAEAAEAMDCSVRTVNNHIVRGLRTLRDRLQTLDPDVL